MDWRDIRARLRREHRHRRRLIAFAFAPQPGNSEYRTVGERKPVLGLRVFRSGKLEEGRRRDEAAFALREIPVFRDEIKNRSAFASGRRRKPELGGEEFELVARCPDHRGDITDFDVIGRG